MSPTLGSGCKVISVWVSQYSQQTPSSSAFKALLAMLSKSRSPGRSPLSSPGSDGKPNSFSLSSAPCGHVWRRGWGVGGGGGGRCKLGSVEKRVREGTVICVQNLQNKQDSKCTTKTHSAGLTNIRQSGKLHQRTYRVQQTAANVPQSLGLMTSSGI